jgi:hypothetical protein
MVMVMPPGVATNMPRSDDHNVPRPFVLDTLREGDAGFRLEERYFAEVRDAGFDTVRLPVKWSAHAGESSPYTISPALFERYWDFGTDFGAFDPERDAWREPIRDALLGDRNPLEG